MTERIVHFTLSDIDFALAQTLREGWDTTREVFEVALGHDPGGSFIAEDDGAAVGMITTTRYDKAAWVGNLIVVPGYRQRGLGERMMRHALAYLEHQAFHTVQLEADPMGVGIYRRLGFADAFSSFRFRSDPPHAPVLKPHDERLADGDWEEAVQLDAGAIGDDRRRLLAALRRRSVATRAIHAQGRLHGYALAFPSTEGVHFGPWVATHPHAAAQLLDGVLQAFPNDAVIVGVPEVNSFARPILQARKFHEQQPCLRMVRGAPIDAGRPDQLYAVANGAMG